MNGHLVPSHLAFVVQLAVEQLPEVKCIVNGLNDTHALVALILLAQAPPVHVVRPGRPDGTHKEAGAKTQFLCVLPRPTDRVDQPAQLHPDTTPTRVRAVTCPPRTRAGTSCDPFGALALWVV